MVETVLPSNKLGNKTTSESGSKENSSDEKDNEVEEEKALHCTWMRDPRYVTFLKIN